MKKKLAVLLAAAMLLGCTPLTAAAEGAVYTPGTYTVATEGFREGMVVEVVLSADRIESIAVLEHMETQGIGSVAVERLPAAMLAAQSPYVDVVSGATITSDALRGAVADAMSQAGFVPREPAPVEEYDWEAEWAAQERQEKIDAGVPYPDGPNVSLNGEYLTFGGIAPMGDEYDDTKVPFRAFLEGMGGKVAYQDGKFIATMPGGSSIMAEPGSTRLSYTVGDKINIIEMYSAPTVESRVTYVSVEALAEALGLDSYYGQYDTIELMDWAAAVAEIDKGFTAFNSYLAAAQAVVDPAKTYANKAKFTLSGTLYGEKTHNTITLTGKGEGLQGPGGYSTTGTVSLDLGTMKESVRALTSMSTAELDAWLKDFSGRKYQVIQTKDALYQKGSIPTGMDKEFPQDVWVKYGSGDVLNFDGGLDNLLSPGAEEPATVGALLRGYYNTAYGGVIGGSSSSPFVRLGESADMLSLFVGDGVFTAKTSGSATAWSVDMDLADLLVALYAKVGEPSAEIAEQLEMMMGDVNTLKLRWVLNARAQNGKLTNTDLSFMAQWGGAFPMTVETKLSGAPLNMSGSASIKGGYLGKLEATLESSSSVTTKSVPTAPPAGESVKTVDEVMQDLWGLRTALPAAAELVGRLMEG